MFAEWEDPDPAQFPNPLGERTSGAASRARDAARALEDDVRDAVDEAMAKRGGETNMDGEERGS